MMRLKIVGWQFVVELILAKALVTHLTAVDKNKSRTALYFPLTASEHKSHRPVPNYYYKMEVLAIRTPFAFIRFIQTVSPH